MLCPNRVHFQFWDVSNSTFGTVVHSSPFWKWSKSWSQLIVFPQYKLQWKSSCQSFWQLLFIFTVLLFWNTLIWLLSKTTRLSNTVTVIDYFQLVWLPSKTTRLSNSCNACYAAGAVWLPSKTTRLSNMPAHSTNTNTVWLPSKTTRLSNLLIVGRNWWTVWLPSKTTRLSNLKPQMRKTPRHRAVLFQMDRPTIYSL